MKKRSALLIFCVISVAMCLVSCAGEGNHSPQTDHEIIISTPDPNAYYTCMIDDHGTPGVQTMPPLIIPSSFPTESLSPSTAKPSDTGNKKAEIKYKFAELTFPEFETAKTISVKDYGAKGDGKTNDAPAVKKAIEALKKSEKGTALSFEKGKTYYFSVPGGYAIDASELENVMIFGNSAQIYVDTTTSYLNVSKCSGVVVSGFTFRMKNYITAASKSIEGIDEKSCSMHVIMNRSLGIASNWSPASEDYCAMISGAEADEAFRISKIQVLNKDKFEYRIYFADEYNAIAPQLEVMQHNGIVCPLPAVEKALDYSVSVTESKDIEIKQCAVTACQNNAVYVSDNTGYTLFNGFNIAKGNDVVGKTLYFASRLDGISVDENHSKVYFVKCNFSAVFGNTAGFSAGSCTVKSVSGTSKDAEISLNESDVVKHWTAKDKVTVISPSSHEILGESSIKSVSENKIVLSEEIEGMKTGVCILNENTVSPGSQFSGCVISGNLSLNSSVKMYDCKLTVDTLYITYPKEINRSVVPHDILFEKCQFAFKNPLYSKIIIDSNNGVRREDTYHCRDIVFKNCTIDKNKIQYGTTEEICRNVTLITK